MSFEEEMQKLRDEQQNIYEDPNNKYVEITIPATGIVGKKCKIKISKKVPMIQLAVSQDIQWKRRDKYDLKAKPEIVCRAFILEEFKDTDKIEFTWEDIGIFQEKPVNLLQAGEYMVEVRAYSTNAYEETNAKRLVKVSDAKK